MFRISLWSLPFLPAQLARVVKRIDIVSRESAIRGVRRRRRSQVGFTLIEVAIALGIFSVGVVIAARMQANAVRSLKTTGETSVAMNLAVSTLETLRAEIPYSGIDGDGENLYFNRFGGQEETNQYAKFLVQWTAETGDYFTDVNVGVYWNPENFLAPTSPLQAKHRLRTVNTRIVNREVFRR